MSSPAPSPKKVHYLAGPDQIHGLLLQENQKQTDLLSQDLTKSEIAEMRASCTTTLALLDSFEGALSRVA